MYVRSLELSNYRNYERVQIDFDKGVNILYGDNAVGKTNVLESIYLSSTTKSHRGSRDKEIVRFGEYEGHIRCLFEKNEVDYQIDIHLRTDKSKGIAINGVKLKKAAELMGVINVILFSPEDLSIIKNGPSERRRFIDSELCQLDKVYLYNLTSYNKIVNQRNSLLKDITYHPELTDTLDVWDSQLISLGTKIIDRRTLFVNQLNEIIYDIHRNLTNESEKLMIKYEPNVEIMDYSQKIKRNREKDIKYKLTSVGPHRDDFIFYINDMDSKKYASQGQQRTAALSLKLSEIKLVQNLTGQQPILLLDDVLSELDSNRQNYLLNSIGNIQTIVTCTGLDEFINSRLTVNKIFKVSGGKVVREN
ncbi:MAG: DNA replication/repair protein RecF [Lachnospiraceae bacterium]|nr:DNA replication/repair protein RecF [Lachnospiraceae bacterium]